MIVDESLLIPAPPERVWRALTDALDRAEWWGYIDLDVTPGGKVEERWSDDSGHPMLTQGVVTEVEEGRMFRFTWSYTDRPVATAVEISLTSAEAGTVVRVLEVGWNHLPDGPATAADHRASWRIHLTNLRRHLSL
ncbi:SRPBCC domain-containing protein [Nonomuraea endophytica]|uniref:SRPBCC domain-containing protein n=1 Tax=Nonomuraea endophytica TaxID=714136 RepID=UPI0037C5D2DA